MLGTTLIIRKLNEKNQFGCWQAPWKNQKHHIILLPIIIVIIFLIIYYYLPNFSF